MKHPIQAYLVGGGIGSLSAAAFMIRDGGVAGANITIFEAAPSAGGSLDGNGNADDGYTLRGGRMLTTDNYECTWDLFKSIPSLSHPGRTVFDETIAFNEEHIPHSMARLVDRNRFKVDVSSMGFSMQDRLELLKLSDADEATLGASCITDWLSPAFFTTEFWYMWATTFAFQPWHSAVEFKRYLHRFMMEFSRIETLAGVKRTVYNQYDSLVRPLISWLQAQGVKVVMDCTVTDFDLKTEDGKVSVTGIHCRRHGGTDVVGVADGDLVFFQNGSMTDASTYGSMRDAPARHTKHDSGGWTLWEKLAAGRPEFGNPAAFNSSIPESYWASFTVTLKDTSFFDQMEKFTGNRAGTGGLVTFKDSNWFMSVVLAHQPHFAGQPDGVQVFWGYALHPDRVGDFVAKPMSECNGEEILRELCGHLNFDFDTTMTKANCIPCRMPYITSMFMPRAKSDRPLPVPANSTNLAFVSQFVEIADDVVFTVEYSVRAAQMAVYELLKIDREVPPIHPHDHSLKVKFDAVIKAFK
ncbi:oleate hydratase [Janthinobacterium sp. CG_23.3]|uniref:oleate hydratase n=1 Tax=unclassified Janthinobacterium TaxID=2610881 RepID=UPI0003499FD1|nr:MULTISPECIES: oleate hydratase [unclassified Janthinobacterium]MEC5162133.1 oleate hydratase [Janthinobacterium sp. CG_S6]